MKQYWQRLAAKMDSRNQRERALIFIMAVVLVLALINTVFFSPLLAKTKRLSQEDGQQKTQLGEIAAQIQLAERNVPSDPDAPTRVRLAAVEQRLAQAASDLKSTQQSLVAPDKMAHLLQDMLTQDRSLTLVSLKTLPVSGLIEPPKETPAQGQAAVPKTEAPQAKPADAAIYKHGVEITVAGSYAALTQYLESLEKLPWHMFWGKVEMRAAEYPRVTLTITVYTLSLDKTWLAI